MRRHDPGVVGRVAASAAAARACPLAAFVLVTIAALVTAFAPAPVHAAALFEETAELPIVLEFPVAQLKRARLKREAVPATLHWLAADGTRASLVIRVRPRGHKRLEGCDFPPLRLEFRGAATAGTPFAGQDSLKLVTQCRPDRRFGEYVRLEQRLYEAWALAAPVAFRTRPVAATYVDTDKNIVPTRGPAFLIEDVDDVAKRAGLPKARVPALEPPELDPANATLLELFHFMIGNTDFSLYRSMDGEDTCCHNSRVLGPVKATGLHVLVPYDFDQAGLINAEYAVPSPVVGVRHVRTRIWRGVCSRNAQVPAAIERMQQLRPQVEALFRAGGLADWAADRAARYLKDFYAILDDPAETKARIYGFCRPDPEPFSPPASSPAATAAPDASSRVRLP